MSAEVKKAATGVYLLFVGQQVTQDEVEGVIQRYDDSAIADGLAAYVVVIEPIRLNNPLQVARWIATGTTGTTTHYIVAGNGRDSMVIAERLQRKLATTPTIVEVAAHQQVAVDRAKALVGVADETDFPTCNYL
ncbi:MAG: hypothetical protein AAF653_12660 [Chloroflexota bacterium]